jgi:hypothetical protein
MTTTVSCLAGTRRAKVTQILKQLFPVCCIYGYGQSEDLSQKLSLIHYRVENERRVKLLFVEVSRNILRLWFFPARHPRIYRKAFFLGEERT